MNQNWVIRMEPAAETLLLASVTGYAIYLLDRVGNVASWNGGAEGLLGWKAEEIIGRHFSEFFLSEDVALGLPKQELERLIQHGQFEEERRRCRKEGSAFWADVTAYPVRDAAGTLLGFGEIVRDITDFKKLERTNTILTTDLQLALDAAQFFPWKWDLDTDIVACSPACLALFGIPPLTPVRSIHFLHSLDPQDRERVDEAARRALEFRTLFRVKMRAAWPEGSNHWVGSIGRAHYDSQGFASFMTGIAFALEPETGLPLG